MLRKLVRLLSSEDLPIVVVNCHGSTIFSSPRRDGWDIKLQTRLESTRGYLRYIARNRQPELRDYDGDGEPRGPEHALEFIKCLF
ncbi:hypothetical protein M5D96_002124 [Drosophila gunungcola]|uniref:Uncharacterized protein n=1 Tax=Drosophila gunungcola TaxID=103775 RepID=A0A9P9YZC1_9MUSC|nr:hypothetical protein M5D96_002124 [Drosophila gunungcola]